MKWECGHEWKIGWALMGVIEAYSGIRLERLRKTTPVKYFLNCVKMESNLDSLVAQPLF
jgi:hypothetical protein